MPTKLPEKKGSGGKANALQKPLTPSEELAAVVGSAALPRGQVVSKVWDYIRSHNLQNPENRREIMADDKLRRVFGKDKVTMFESNFQVDKGACSSYPVLFKAFKRLASGASASEKADLFAGTASRFYRLGN